MMTREQRKERTRIRCSGCENFWTGLRACHCAGCHRTFSGLTAFDRHRGRRCVDPFEAGLVLVEKDGWDCWAKPGTWEDRPQR
jgi:hypothetical protein